MSKRRCYVGRILALALALLTAPMLVAAATPPPAPANPLYPPGIGWNPVVDYTKPNFAQSPNLRKFVDSLPGLGAANMNNLGQYIPVATPDTTTFPGDATSSAANPASDYYEIQLKQYNQQMHSDLPATGTTLRGYAQTNTTDPTVQNVHQYLGPLIIAKSYDPTKPAGLNGNGKPVRLKFFNRLPTGPAGNLFLPVDTTIMGAGTGPLSATELYTQNRANIHLHGGDTPWISDGTPHQWITPAGETTSYPKGVSFQNVPDMVNGSVVNGTAVPCIGGATCFTASATDGTGTYYYPNQMSARLMFYHDHAYGITRLNVYAGNAAGYLLTDQYEEDMISGTTVAGVTNAKLLPDQSGVLQGNPPAPVPGGGLYHYGIPLIIQDKSFVHDANTPSAAAKAAFPATGYTPMPETLATDPLWQYYAGTTGGNLWFPHEYMPVENPFDPTGNTPNGRWDYAPFMIPPMVPLNLTLPSPTLVPEAFADTAVVNGTAFPYAVLPPDAVRLRILNACNDRTLNLQLYFAKDKNGVVCKSPNVFDAASCTEVSMVPAAPNAAFPTWPKDGRDGGVPDPLTKGPDWIQIGSEGGLLAKVGVLPAQPIDFNYNRQVIPLAGVTSKSLLLLPAVRADVVVDFSRYTNGDVLIMYSDAPAAMPNYWPLNDYYTDGPDQTATGGPVSIPPGFGPNTRTLMQIRIAGTKTSTFDFSSNGPNPATFGASLSALQTALPQVFAASQPPILVPQLAYNAAYPSGPHHFAGTTDTYVQAYQTTMNTSGTGQPLAKILTTLPGNNYTTPPRVAIVGGGGTGATATAGLNPIGGITLLTAGSGYTSVPTVTLGPPAVAGSVQATAAATISGGGVNAINIVQPGSGYNNTVTAPTCTISAPTGVGGVAATCQALLPTLNTVGAITITNPGSGYTSQPQVFLVPTAGGGLGATADAMLQGDLAMTGKNLTEGFDVDFGRMEIRLGSTPNPLTPTIGAGFVVGIARYIDPPTEIFNDGETILWRLAHLGVDSHAMHFHLFNVQVINRVDWTGVIKPPYEDEIGWKETIRTNPMEDLIVAIQPKAPVLPFRIPNSNRVLDPTTPLNSTTNFFPVVPPPGVPAVAQQSNVMTDFGWEYVWHCHLLGHEENDMMRPMVMNVPNAGVTPTALDFGDMVITKTSPAQTVTVSNTGAAPLLFNSIGVTGTNASEFTQTTTCGASLAVGATCTISVRFLPTATDARSATMVINTNDVTLFQIPLSGNGVLMGVDTMVFRDLGTAGRTVATPAFSTTTTNQLLLAFVAAGTPSATSPATTVTGITTSGGGITWTLVRRTNTQRGTSEVWRAFAPAALANTTVTATFNQSVPSRSITLVSFVGADTTGSGSGAIGATGSGNALTGAPTASLVTTRAGSLVFGVGNDWDAATVRTLGKNQTMVHEYPAPTADDYWVQRQTSGIPLAGTTVTINDTAPTNDRWNLTLVEIRPPAAAGPAAGLSTTALTFGNQLVNTTSPAQTVTLSNIGTTPLTVNSIGLSGANAADFTLTNGCGASLAAGANCSMTVTFSPTALAAYSASLDISSDDPANPALSVPLTGTGAAPGLALDVTAASSDIGTATASLASPSFSTTSTNELLLAFVAAGNPSSTAPATTVTTMTGGGLTWVLVGRTNTQRGTSEVWRAFSAVPVSNAVVTATLNQTVPSGSITVLSFTGVDTTGTNGSGAIGATGTGNARTGAPTASLVTTRANSWVFGVGNDWDFPTARTLGANQTMVHQYLAPTSDTYWVQRLNSTTPLLGTSVTVNDTAPTTDRWNLRTVEIRTP